MRLLNYWSAPACLVAAFCGPAQTSPTPSDCSVKTSSGTARGFIDSQYPDVLQFLGIPYGVAPVGELRFMPSKRFSGKGQLNTTNTPKACPQVNSTIPTIWSVSTPQFLNSAPWSEDCLSLSVWTPTSALTAKHPLPVIIFMHGGGLISGSSSVPYQQPQPWIQRSKSHIVVNLQYRLDIFGFPNAAGLNTTNLGILDQRLAVEWVRDNINAFGGDPQRITLWGQSAGAASADGQNFAYYKDPIVNSFIQDSGTAILPIGNGFGLFTRDPDHTNFTYVANSLGCPADAQRQLSCMRAIPASSIISFLANYTNSNTQPPLFFIGTPDERTVFANYTERYLQGLFSNRSLLLGSNTREGELFAPFPSLDPQQNAPNQTYTTDVTLALFQCPAAKTARLRTTAGRKTYRYIYDGNFTDISPLYWEGAYHAGELPQVFGTRGIWRGPASPYEVQTSEAMQDLWLGFAKQPNYPEQFGWMESSTGQMLELGAPGQSPVLNINVSVVEDSCQQAGLL